MNEDKSGEVVTSEDITAALISFESKLTAKFDPIILSLRMLAKHIDDLNEKAKYLEKTCEALKKEIIAVEKKTHIESSDGSIEVMVDGEGRKDLMAETDDGDYLGPTSIVIRGVTVDIPKDNNKRFMFANIRTREIRFSDDEGEVAWPEEERYDLQNPFDFHLTGF